MNSIENKNFPEHFGALHHDLAAIVSEEIGLDTDAYSAALLSDAWRAGQRYPGCPYPDGRGFAGDKNSRTAYKKSKQKAGRRRAMMSSSWIKALQM